MKKIILSINILYYIFAKKQNPDKSEFFMFKG